MSLSTLPFNVRKNHIHSKLNPSNKIRLGQTCKNFRNNSVFKSVKTIQKGSASYLKKKFDYLKSINIDVLTSYGINNTTKYSLGKSIILQSGNSIIYGHIRRIFRNKRTQNITIELENYIFTDSFAPSLFLPQLKFIKRPQKSFKLSEYHVLSSQ